MVEIDIVVEEEADVVLEGVVNVVVNVEGDIEVVVVFKVVGTVVKVVFV